MKRFEIPGTRVVKTGVAIFLTAWICGLLGWPPVFAVITAIVTLEPTVVDSIKKGLVRFPASAIGSAYAVLFIFLFGDSPITYTLAAVLTIITCYRLKLHSGLLVAAITAVAMIEVVYDNYLMSFFIRLGTTTIGILVSTFVNMFILPPNYVKDIHKNIDNIYRRVGQSLLEVLPQLAQHTGTRTIQGLDTQIKKTEDLIRFQKGEAKFHPLVGSNKHDFYIAEQQINKLRLMHYHLTNLDNLSIKGMNLSEDDQQTVKDAIIGLARHINKNNQANVDEHEVNLKLLMETFWKDANIVDQNDESVTLPPVLVLLYELVSFYELVLSFNNIQTKRKQKSKSIKKRN